MLKILILNSIRFYQKFISPNFGRVCRFYPSCSQYFFLAIKNYGLLKGLFLGLHRILKCHPLSNGGVDFP